MAEGAPLRTRRTCCSANPRAPQRILLLVFDHRLERQSGAVATRDWQSDVATTIWWECAGNGPTRRAMELRPHYREHRVLDALHRAAVFCDQRIGWNRIGVALSLTIIAVAAVVLYRILRTMDASEVDALLTTDVRGVTPAAFFVAGGYFILPSFDLFVLLSTGRRDV